MSRSIELPEDLGGKLSKPNLKKEYIESIKNKESSKNSYSGTLKMKKHRNKKWKNGKKK